MMMKIVEPYMIIISPGDMTPALIASAAASMVPVRTGVSFVSPVTSAVSAITSPAISDDQRISGSIAQSTTASVLNNTAVQNCELEAGMTAADVTRPMYLGESKFEGK